MDKKIRKIINTYFHDDGESIQRKKTVIAIRGWKSSINNSLIKNSTYHEITKMFRRRFTVIIFMQCLSLGGVVYGVLFFKKKYDKVAESIPNIQRYIDMIPSREGLINSAYSITGGIGQHVDTVYKKSQEVIQSDVVQKGTRKVREFITKTDK